jgi:hypothetical protein
MKMTDLLVFAGFGKSMYVIGHKAGYDRYLKKNKGLQKAGYDRMGNDAGRVYPNIREARHAFALEPDSKKYGVYKLKHSYHPEHIVKHSETGENLLKHSLPIHKRVWPSTEVKANLNTKQKAKVRTWTKDKKTGKNHYTNTKKISDHTFGNKTRVKISDSEEKAPVYPNKDVMKHLNDNGHYSDIGEYQKGITHHKADLTKKRPLKIGKILEKTKAPDEIKKSYMNDPARSASKQAGHLTITASRHPYDVAGMSTDRGWNSCMHMDHGASRKYLPKDIEHGTHVAYLHHKNDPTISHPVARIALKPFKSKNGHTILHPEDSVYGTADQHFKDTVSKWANKHFPMKPDIIYHRNSKLYNDSGINDKSKIHWTNWKDTLKNNDLKDLNDMAREGELAAKPVEHKDLKDVAPHLHDEKHRGLIDHLFNYATPDALEKLHDHPNIYVRRAAASYAHNLSPKTQRKMAQDTDKYTRANIAWTGTDKDTLKHLSNDPDSDVRTYARKNLKGRFPEEHAILKDK